MGRLHRPRAGGIPALAVCAVLCLTSPGIAGPQDEDLPRLRTLDPQLALLMQQGLDQSQTFEHLVDGVQRSDLIIHVERHARFRDGLSGSFQLVGSRGGQRYVRIALNSALNPRELLVLLAHELQHANELAEAPHVFDERGMREFFCKTGEIRQHGYDTVAAQAVTRQVAAELAAPRPDR